MAARGDGEADASWSGEREPATEVGAYFGACGFPAGQTNRGRPLGAWKQGRTMTETTAR